jgi:hypothetical protein
MCVQQQFLYAGHTDELPVFNLREKGGVVYHFQNLID